ncbi:probable E3 ubiquitin-protein ligase makorin-1 isoform X2 [Cavia porcellus]|uniref:probable E3 ubiquitin-protein ligase makorin-1 isoform X2 n=1 Tax=Cavia porcellus TaxID=10141 RepID=UPI002FDFFD65
MNPTGADGNSHGGERGPPPQQLRRNLGFGTPHSGPSGLFAPDRVCRYFQLGFCFHGDRCSYQHLLLSRPLEWGRRYSAPLVPVQGPWLGLTRRASEPSFLPSAPVSWAWGWTRAQLASALGLHEAPGSSRRSLSAASAARDPSHAQEPQPGLHLVQELSNTLQRLDLAEDLVGDPQGQQDSRDVVCGICRDRVWDKPEPERVFGILPNCSHPYCLGCLRTWRQTLSLPPTVIKACPQCRIYSSYIIPCKVWVSAGPQKERLIRDFTARTRQIQCRFFMQGNGYCPFGSRCIYLHQLPESALASASLWPEMVPWRG